MIQKRDGSVVPYSAGMVIHKGDKVYVSLGGGVNWNADVRVWDDPAPVVTPLTTTCDCTPPGGDGGGDGGPCFSGETKITLADGTEKEIQYVEVEDQVMCCNQESKTNIDGFVRTKTASKRSGMYLLTLANEVQIKVSEEHPIYIQKSGGEECWAVIDKNAPLLKKVALHLKDVAKLEVGDKVFSLHLEWIEIKKIEKVSGEVRTYNLWKIDGAANFYANGILVSTYEV
jgi:hypothetical protein